MTTTIQDCDYLIVGQGLAGTLLAHFLLQKEQSVRIINTERKNAASIIAAGIINPITGRRYVKSWRIDELIPFALETYHTLEEQLDIKIFYSQNILRSIFNHREEQDWYARTLEPGYQKYIVNQPNPADFAGHTDTVYRYGELTHSGRVDIKKLVESYRAFLKEQALLMDQIFDYQQLILTEDTVQYGNIRAKKIIFCEGIGAEQNPFFNYLPFQGTKGEVLIVRIPDANFGKIFKHRIFIVPLGEDRYWVGSTYDWQYDTLEPTPSGKQFLSERLADILKVPFEILEHHAAVRPTVKDRRPFLGNHPDFPQLAIFNGLGAKGASLGPFFAQHMTDFLLNNTPLDKEISISRVKASPL